MGGLVSEWDTDRQGNEIDRRLDVTRYQGVVVIHGDPKLSLRICQRDNVKRGCRHFAYPKNYECGSFSTDNLTARNR